jgi:glycosyltransferase involved in cell wall biosynthesis
MEQTDIFVMPSILEGQPVALVEAMAYGRSIVATNVGGIPELIRDGVNGFLCSPADSHCLEKKINLLIENIDLRFKMAEASRQSYETGSFRTLTVCEKFARVYEGVLRNDQLLG